jgi:hypothetical protein
MFHHTKGWYESGTMIQPGSWGRHIRGIGGMHRSFLREAVFELVRQEEFDDKPSRLDCSFAYTDAGYARTKLAFHDESPNDRLLYEVEPADSVSPLHMADLYWIDEALPALHGDPAKVVVDLARQYWRGVIYRQESREVIVAGSLRVIRLILSTERDSSGWSYREW